MSRTSQGFHASIGQQIPGDVEILDVGQEWRIGQKNDSLIPDQVGAKVKLPKPPQEGRIGEIPDPLRSDANRAAVVVFKVQRFKIGKVRRSRETLRYLGSSFGAKEH